MGASESGPEQEILGTTIGNNFQGKFCIIRSWSSNADVISPRAYSLVAPGEHSMVPTASSLCVQGEPGRSLGKLALFFFLLFLCPFYKLEGIW